MQRIIIIGASSGIGATTAVHFAKLGCQLAINGRDETALHETKEKCISAAAGDANFQV